MLAQPNSPAFYPCIKRLVLPNVIFSDCLELLLISVDVCFFMAKIMVMKEHFLPSSMDIFSILMPSPPFQLAQKSRLSEHWVSSKFQMNSNIFFVDQRQTRRTQFFPTWTQFHDLFRENNIIVVWNVRESRSELVWVIWCNFFSKKNVSKTSVDPITNLESVT